MRFSQDLASCEVVEFYSLNLVFYLHDWKCKIIWLYQTTDEAISRKERHEEEKANENEDIVYKIEVPANRYFKHIHGLDISVDV